MTTAYTSLLGLALPVTGELSGTWGDTVNNSITSLLDSAIAGTTTLSTDADVTLTTTTGAANTAREAILLCSGARTALRTITAPAQSKIYTIINSTTGGFAVKIVGAGPTTGLTIPNGASAVVAWNGSDFIEVGSATVGNFTVNGNLTVTGTSTLTGAVSTASNLTFTGTGNRITGDFSNATTASRIAFQSSTTNTNTALMVLPSGTATISGADLFNNSDPTNAAYASIQSRSTEVRLQSAITGTGTYLPMTFYTGGSERMRVDTSGNLGIGTTSPSSYGSPLSVYAATNPTLAIASGNANAYLRLYSTSDNNMYLTNTGGSMTMITANTERMRIDSSGNVGIGQTSQVWDEKLGVRLATSGSGTVGLGVYSGSTTYTSSMIRVQAETGGSGWKMYEGRANGGSQLFWVDGSGGAYFAGNVGIGTSSPSYKLDVRSTFAVLDGSSNIGFYANGSLYTQIWQTLQSTNDFIIQTTASKYISFGINSAEKVRIDTSGNLLVGASSQIGAEKLGVTSGTTNATQYTTIATKGGSGLYVNQQQTTSVSTSATVILASPNYCTFCLVHGSDGTNRFSDVVLMSIGTGTVNVISSLSASGTPAARTYSQSSSTFRLAMASGTYTVQVSALTMNS